MRHVTKKVKCVSTPTHTTKVPFGINVPQNHRKEYIQKCKLFLKIQDGHCRPYCDTQTATTKIARIANETMFFVFLGAQININEYYFNDLMSSSSFSGNQKSLEVKNCKLRSCVSQLTGYTKGCNLYMYTFMTPISNIGYVNLTSEFIIGYKGVTADNSAAN